MRRASIAFVSGKHKVSTEAAARPLRPVPALTAEQIALHAGITANRGLFSLENALKLYAPHEVKSREFAD